MAHTVLWLLLLGQQETKDQSEKAIADFRATYKGVDEEARVRAVDTLAGRGGASAITALVEVARQDTERVRVAASRALGAYDVPSAVEAAAKALESNAKSPKVVVALTRALEELDREAGAAILNEMLRKHDREEMAEPMPVILDVIGKLGSLSSVEPLIQLLRHAEKESRDVRVDGRFYEGSQRHIDLRPPLNKALRDITGGRESLAAGWDKWWSENAKAVLARRTAVYRCTATGKRWEEAAGRAPECPHHEKPVTHGELVKTKLK